MAAVTYVGDSEVDAATAAAVGVPFLLFTEGYRKTPVEALPHRPRFDRFLDLPGLLENLAATPPSCADPTAYPSDPALTFATNTLTPRRTNSVPATAGLKQRPLAR